MQPLVSFPVLQSSCWLLCFGCVLAVMCCLCYPSLPPSAVGWPIGPDKESMCALNLPINLNMCFG